ncbi:hypothetical protein AGLY_002355 [Aphis glycines]|uniref:Uncharacterized protein n=1 Tax=Aphis glycines TaxID=307491 RepID=A0A6G0U372_APHGL|nr:hypothetical protein AGLY_002355 [Aphis glycines]
MRVAKKVDLESFFALMVVSRYKYQVTNVFVHFVKYRQSLSEPLIPDSRFTDQTVGYIADTTSCATHHNTRRVFYNVDSLFFLLNSEYKVLDLGIHCSMLLDIFMKLIASLLLFLYILIIRPFSSIDHTSKPKGDGLEGLYCTSFIEVIEQQICFMHQGFQLMKYDSLGLDKVRPKAIVFDELYSIT